ncbi:MAG: hypothetical protein LBI53_00930 [Candidatus Peribacteria bacterium]|nr:hypothetical protein [Candidatus Peribacteria bacterium]
MTTVGNSFFHDFNSQGELTSLPEGSFNTSNVTTVGNAFFNSFNRNGKLTYLPNSFKRPTLDTTNASKTSNF